MEASEETKVYEFYERIQEEMNKTGEECGKIIIVEVWNARLGKDKNIGEGCLGEHGEEYWKEIEEIDILLLNQWINHCKHVF